MNKESIHLIGYASGIAANNTDCALGPWYLYYHPELFMHAGLDVAWQGIVQATSLHRGIDVLSIIKEKADELGGLVKSSIENAKQFCVLGGDHSSAIATWSVVAHAHRQQGDIGLIWIDAHMDSHTPETSETKNIHGMPLAHLLGKGSSSLVNLFDSMPALKPENVCLIGTRSYEEGEEALLKSLNVKIIGMDEINREGIMAAVQAAVDHVSRHTIGFGISLDLDGIDPLDAPGVGCRVPSGISGRELVSAFKNIPMIKTHLGLEIVEYNPIEDVNHQTAKLAVELLHAICG